MSTFEFLLTYLVGGGAMFAAGWIIGSQRAESEAERIRKWWFNRERRNER
jgi:hypothetical protein